MRWRKDIEEMRNWRGLSQSEMHKCWKNLAEGLDRKFSTSTRSKQLAASGEQEESTENHEMKHQQRKKIMKGLTKKIRSKERMDAESCRDCIK